MFISSSGRPHEKRIDLRLPDVLFSSHQNTVARMVSGGRCCEHITWVTCLHHWLLLHLWQ